MQSKRFIIPVVFLVGAAAGAAAMFLDRPARPVEPEQGEVYRIVNPLVEAQVGEWALYRLGDGKTMRLEVLAVHPLSHVVTIREENRDGKTNVTLSDASRPIGPNHFLWGFDGAGALVTRIYEDPLTVADHTFQAFCVETIGRTSGAMRHWYSPDVPVVGLIRQERAGEGPYSVLTELIDWSGR